MDDEREVAIRRLVAEAQATQSDPEPFLALHTADAVVVNFGGRRVLGRDALGEALRAALATPLAEVTTTAEVQDIRFLRPDVAIVSCTKQVLDERDEPGELGEFPSQGRLTYVVARGDDGAWRIALAQTTPVPGT
jgi:uncharacterized protein (TIGR02246 family)